MKKETFDSLLKEFSYRYDTRTVFDDFLTMALASFSHNPVTGKSYDEDLYLTAIDKYKTDPIRHNFAKTLGALTLEMEERVYSDTGNDVLGEFYEQNLYRKGASQYFTPWSICSFLAKSTVEDTESGSDEKLRILDPCCGSGRMLLATSKEQGRYREYYGIDIDPVCVKMTAINLFLNGMFHSEVLCANALIPEDFTTSYRISFLPFGVFRIKEKENSRLWHLLKNSWDRQEKVVRTPAPFEAKDNPEGGVTQLKFF